MLKSNLTVRKPQEGKQKGNSENRLKIAQLTPKEEQTLAWAAIPANKTAFLTATTKILSAIQDHQGLQLLYRFTEALCGAAVGPERQASFHAQHYLVKNHLTGRWRALRETGALSAGQLTLLFDITTGEIPPLRPENHPRLTSKEQWALTLVWIIRQIEQAYDQLNGMDNDMILEFLTHVYQLLREAPHQLIPQGC